MTPSREISTRVASVLAESLGVGEDDVIPSATLQGDLGAESIDFLDIVFRLEREFGIKIPRGELFPDSILGEQADLVHKGRVTDRGMVESRSRMPYADLADFERDRRFSAVADLFTVGLVVRYVEWKLDRDGRAVTLAPLPKVADGPDLPELAVEPPRRHGRPIFARPPKGHRRVGGPLPAA
jgi:acyl carrier protein